MFVIESAIAAAAQKLGVPARVIQERNVLAEGDEFPYGQVADHAEAKHAWDKAIHHFELDRLEQDVEAFNQKHRHFKKGIALQPICFGISFTTTMLTNACALAPV